MSHCCFEMRVANLCATASEESMKRSTQFRRQFSVRESSFDEGLSVTHLSQQVSFSRLICEGVEKKRHNDATRVKCGNE